MVTTNTKKNKLIFKNTMMLYIRMFISISISLYTSRIVLNTLGISDYGIYNVVGGIVTMLTFLNGTLGTSTSRYITWALGKNDLHLSKKIFSCISSINFLFAMLIVIIGETIGVWFLYNKLQIPLARMNAAFWVLQFSIFTAILNIISIPFNASIIAHEKMKVFAYMSILDSVLKLLIVFLLIHTKYDKLIIYSFLLFSLQLLERFIYSFYCKKKFQECKYNFLWDKELFKEILSFISWTMNGSIAVVCYTQGLNILLNIFFGPSVNAARGIAVQVQATVFNFCNSFQSAISPQIVKSYVSKNISYLHELIISSSKYSYYLLLLISLPLGIEIDYVLKLWLNIVPSNAGNFIRVMLFISILNAIANPIKLTNQAEGNIKKFQIYEGTTLLLILPISYIMLKFTHIAIIVFFVHIVCEIIAQYFRLKITLPKINMSLKTYYTSVIKPILLVSISSIIIPFWISTYLKSNFINLLIICVISTISIFISIYILGINKQERLFLTNKINTFIRKK